ncbi:hypothetical protein GWI33_004089 [Rhynchophorus ferrugineus]|uniref:Uncharacterized protein n=1 Tax=Rhynchophorus ferrugineus TaxID=354439 RepID=A0A834IQK1_RHYFE|nr:hypothetical protein GWI33_004089 [Rhynchophorus ferrugineus]
MLPRHLHSNARNELEVSLQLEISFILLHGWVASRPASAPLPTDIKSSDLFPPNPSTPRRLANPYPNPPVLHWSTRNEGGVARFSPDFFVIRIKSDMSCEHSQLLSSTLFLLQYGIMEKIVICSYQNLM